MKKLFLITAFLISFSASAIDLDSARSQGLVGEKRDGYVGVVDTSSAEAKALVAEINAKRKAAYAEISKKNGQSVSLVSKLAADKIIDGLSSGSFYQDTSGKWIKK